LTTVLLASKLGLPGAEEPEDLVHLPGS